MRTTGLAGIVLTAAVLAGIGYAQHYAHSRPQPRFEDKSVGGAKSAETIAPYSAPTLVLELADELRLTASQREEVAQLDAEHERGRLSRPKAQRWLYAILSDEQIRRYESLRHDIDFSENRPQAASP